ncbi:NusG domain II-containing protein [Enterococcus columbae]|uniref:Uncharacterized protein n=1 Tax=Enterococcus columbae DSM 7374 = ATCC 51263 TaxID=1121865 RepID=S1NEB7_9ENTE|nr:NusG domain II-containing protein [Enterococcus columbae]EOT40023.1 hypothetical protein OMW_01812 [Enterococcus columbae DSM 7374 = ATCC 51263]EOW84008.1 hypothetical protein I568_01455 [Enterococcus columbae DSM 7374 = ATCC 51263]
MKLKTFINKSRMKPWDFFILFSLILASFAPLVLFSIQQASQPTVSYTAVLKVDGKELKSFPLSTNQKRYTYKYTDPDGDYNLIEIDHQQIRIKAASCLDQICVQRGWIRKPGETIVCLPHKLVIEIKASDGSETGSVIY